MAISAPQYQPITWLSCASGDRSLAIKMRVSGQPFLAIFSVTASVFSSILFSVGRPTMFDWQCRRRNAIGRGCEPMPTGTSSGGHVFLATSWLLVAAFVQATAAADKPNVLFIAIDDLRDWPGCYHVQPAAKTPHLDELA